MGLRVFVTRELFPFTAGGIGRVIANILSTSTAKELQRTAIVFLGSGPDEAAFQATYPGVAFLVAQESSYRLVDEQGRLYPPKEAFSTSWLHWESILALQALRRLERLHGSLDYVEFVDWGAAGFATVQEKRLGRELQCTTIAVRLHTTDSVLAAFEPRRHDVHGLALYDLERKVLADCDLIVGQLVPVADGMRRFYGFAEEEWAPRTVIHAPPVLLDTVPLATRSVPFERTTPLVFSSKLQDIKRPDVFVQGCAQFMLANPGYEGKAYFLAHAFDPAYHAEIVRLIPPSLMDRFVFMRGMTGAARERFIAGAVCIFPSPWESFCLAAYEASLSGAICVHNAANVAFGDGTPWQHRVNCWKFAGSTSSLAAALNDLFTSEAAKSLEPVKIPEDALPWNRDRVAQSGAQSADPVTVVLLNRGAGAGLYASLDSILATSHPFVEVLVIDDASGDPVSAGVLEQLDRLDGSIVRVRRMAVSQGQGGAWGEAVREVKTPLVAFLESGCELAPGFLALAAAALHPGSPYVAVTGPQALAEGFEDVASGVSAGPSNFWVVHGEARASGVYQNRFALDALVVRTDVATSTGFDESLGPLALWEFLYRMTAAGGRTLVAADVQAVRTSAAVGTADSVSSFALVQQPVAGVLMRGKQVVLGRLVLPSYAFLPPAAATAAFDATELEQRYIELRSSETVRLALFIAGSIRRLAPWALGPLRRVMDVAVRLRRR